MNKEEKEAIEFFEKSFKKKIPPYWYDDTISNIEEKIKTVLNLIQKQDKIIDKFSKALVNCVGTCPIDYNDDFENDCENCQDTLEKCWIEYFKKVVDEDVKD